MGSTQNELINIVIRFNDALNARDVDAMMALVTDDTIFENTDPSPDGTRYVGQVQVRAFWEEFFKSSAQTKIEIEEIFATAERCTMRWTYRWVDHVGQPGHIRGVDVYRLTDGLIAEKLSYVKG